MRYVLPESRVPVSDMPSRTRIADRAPDPRLRIDPAALGLAPLPRSFFLRDTRRVARDLLSCWIARRWRGAWYGGRIVETEAYLGPGDRAAHSWGGRRTPRVEPMYAAGGHLYVFLVYGMHHCANVVTGAPGDGQAVLLRAVTPLVGIEAMRARRKGRPDRALADGPGKLCQAFGLALHHDGVDMCAPGAPVWIGDDGTPPPSEPRVGTRVGISSGTDRPWRWRTP
jgi:DNA-3-methyladenine glycosylase